jgi:UDP-N-acetylmuramoyl-L-alanyl-D-glutamate--2,6-diaminopimelate ligase
MPYLSDLVSDLPVALPSAAAVIPITGVTGDSRQVAPGFVFVAIRGQSFDGHRFISSVIQAGATAVFGTNSPAEVGNMPAGGSAPYFQVPDARLALAILSANFYGRPGAHLRMLGVTGTDGKTTTTNLIYHILQAANLSTGMISTVNAVIGPQVLDTGFHVTTPDAPDVQRYLAMMVEAGLSHAVLETTSHGWAQNRVDACEFDVGVITNITHEHLNDHGSFDNYRAAKARLFTSLALTLPKAQGNPRLAVLNKDDSSFDYLAQVCQGSAGVRSVTYSLEQPADFMVRDLQFDPRGLQFLLVGKGFAFPVRSSLVGAFNVSNILAAAAAAIAGLEIDPEAVRQGVEALRGIPGRMERIDLGQEFTAIVDFAHTPNALRRAIQTARQLTRRRVIVVFGSAGLRDRQKRVMMAETAAEMADLSIFTAEDPRTESLDAILAEMAGGARSKGAVEGQGFLRIPDRREALRQAVALARPGDLVMACGKGHEQSMCFGTIEYPWDDRTALRAALGELLGLTTLEMPFLPTPGTIEP